MTIEYIEEVICKERGIIPLKLHSESRDLDLRLTRQIIMYFALKFGYTEAQTGYFFERDHATAHHAKRVIQNDIDNNRAFRELMDDYAMLLEGNKLLCRIRSAKQRVNDIKLEMAELIEMVKAL